MKSNRHFLPILTLGLLGSFLLPTPGRAQGEAGPEHRWLQKLDGTWTGTVKTDGGDSSATMVYKSACHGLWFVGDFQGEFGGQPFQGHSVDGYDTAKKKFVSVWVDSMNTRPMIFEGELDAARKVLTYTGDGTGFDGQPAKFKSVTQLPDDDHMTVTMYIIGSDGTENRMLSIAYIRKR